jgi:hypothetical protein
MKVTPIDVNVRIHRFFEEDRPRLVVIESPFAGEDRLARARNELYAQEALRDSLHRGEAPFASHLLYPQVLDDNVPAERYQGIQGQIAWIDAAGFIAVYVDRGISAGMSEAIIYALKRGFEIQLRALEPITAAAVDAMLAQAVPPEALFSDVRLVGPAGTSGQGFVTPHLDNVAEMIRRDDVAAARVTSPLEADLADLSTPAPPRPIARPDGPASSWGAAPAPEAGA